MNIDGKKFKELLAGGAKALELNRDYVDSLNVFPVPDGDTGTNMSLTIAYAVKEANKTTDRLSDVVVAFANGALRGARGNSGVIFSQIAKGLSIELETESIVTPKIFSKALQKAAETAYAVTTKPKEGTILTVIRTMGEASVKIAKTKNIEFKDFFEKVIESGKDILAKTPEMLPILAKAGVVDAGGCGLITIFEGMLNTLIGNEHHIYSEITRENKAVGNLVTESDILENDYENITFQYCTEYFIIHLNNTVTSAEVSKYREYLMSIGDCVLVIDNPDLIKTHVHTNNPDMALKAALQLGELDGLKIENMMEQHRKIVAEKEETPKELAEYGIIAVCPGDGFEQIFKELGVQHTIHGGQTINPSVSSMLDGIKKVHAKNVIILPNNSNVIFAANQAKGLVETNVTVIPTTSPAEGISAMLGFNPEESVEINVENMNDNFAGVKTIEVTRAVRNTKMNRMSVKIGDYIAIQGKTLLAKGEDLNAVVLDSVKQVFDNDCLIAIYYGKEMSMAEGQELSEEISKVIPDADVTVSNGGQQHYNYIIAIE